MQRYKQQSLFLYTMQELSRYRYLLADYLVTLVLHLQLMLQADFRQKLGLLWALYQSVQTPN